MRELLRLIHLEFYKMKHMSFFFLHLLIPVFGILVFLCYYGISPHSRESELSSYVIVLTAALPLVISVVCAQAVSPEEGNHFLVFLGTAVKRKHAFLAKWVLVFFMGLFGMALAVGGFMAGYSLILKRCELDFSFMVMIILVMWLGSTGMYVMHLYLNLWKPKSISIGIGAVESVLSALMLTGLGDGLWQFLPCAFCGRWEGLLMRYWFKKSPPVTEEFIRHSFAVNIIVTAGIVLIAAAGFYFYEGRRTDD